MKNQKAQLHVFDFPIPGFTPLNDVIQELNISRMAVFKYRRDGRLPTYKILDRLYVRRADLEQTFPKRFARGDQTAAAKAA